MLAGVAARLDGVLLVIAVDRFLHPLEQQARLCPRASSGSQSEPQITLMTFQPAPRNSRFEFLDDLAVAAHRTVEPLQVAVDDPDQVVELFARGQRERAERFGLVGFAVADERPDLRLLAGR